jgi:hypothetical protein
MHLPIAFFYPLRGILGRALIGLALLALGTVMLLFAVSFWPIVAIAIGLFGTLVAASNLRALVDRDWRKITLSEDGVEIRYGFTRRYYRFLDYSEYRISRLGVRRFLTALPIEVDQVLGERAARIRTTLYDRPAFITPMPVFGDGAPKSLTEWQALLNESRRAAFVSAGIALTSDAVAGEPSPDDARRGAKWNARAQAGAGLSRLSRRAYGRGRIVLTATFFVILLAPVGITLFARQVGVVLCWTANGSTCSGIGLAIPQAVLLGGPVLAIAVFVLGGAWLAVRRAHDLDVDLPYWRAVVGALSRGSSLQYRLSAEEGTPRPNRFGTVPPN